MRVTVPFLMLLALCAAASAQTMKPTAADKMMPPGEQEKMHACQKLAADQNVKMDERAKFVMDCMTKK